MKFLNVAFIATTICRRTQAAHLRGINDSVKGPFDILQCMFQGRTNEEKCHESVDVDGKPCDFCTLSSNGQEAGLCVSSEVAENMQQVNPDVKCDGSTLSGNNQVESLDVSSSQESLRCTVSAFTDKEKCAQVEDEYCQYCVLDMKGQEIGFCLSEDIASYSFLSDVLSCEPASDYDTDADADADADADVDANINTGYSGFIGPFDQLKCTLEARGDEEKCHESVDADGDPCDYCTISSNGQEAGLCVSSDLAAKMEQVNPDVKCDGSKTSGTEVESADLPSNLPSLRCTVSAFTDKEKCAQVDDEYCQYCELDVNGQEVGLCLNEEVASELSFLNQKVYCEPASDDAEVDAVADADADADVDVDADVTVNGPFDQLKCTIEARADEATCHESVDADGEPCDYCTISSNGQEAGICVSSDLATKMEQINPDQITCNTATSSLHDNDVFIESFSTCLKVGLTGGNADKCRNTIDDASSEHCVFCQSPVDTIGLCMPPDFHGKTGRFYQCDDGAVGVDVAVA